MKNNLSLLVVVASLMLVGCQNETISGLSFKANSFYNRNLMAHVDSLNSNDSSNQQTSEQQESTNNHSTEDTPENQNTLDNAVAMLNQDSEISSTNIESINHSSSNNSGSSNNGGSSSNNGSSSNSGGSSSNNGSSSNSGGSSSNNGSSSNSDSSTKPSQPTTPPVVEETKKPVDLLDWNHIKSTLIAKGESLGLPINESLNRENTGYESPWQSSYMTVTNEDVIGYIGAQMERIASAGVPDFNLEMVVQADGNVNIYLIR